MKLLSAIWRYWKWLCVALLTSFAVLAVIAAIITSFKIQPLDKTPIEHCIDTGGTWDEDVGECRSAA